MFNLGVVDGNLAFTSNQERSSCLNGKLRHGNYNTGQGIVSCHQSRQQVRLQHQIRLKDMARDPKLWISGICKV